MENQDKLSTEQFAALAVEKPLEWLSAYLAENEMEDGPGEYSFHPSYHKALGGLVLIEVSSVGGYEGGGECAEVTYAIAPENNRAANGRVENAVAYVEYAGHYESYNGTEWDNEAYVVYPRDVTVVQYHTTEMHTA